MKKTREQTVTLTVADWEEVLNALHSKSGLIARGYFGKMDNVNRKWRKHLLSIMRKVEAQQA